MTETATPAKLTSRETWAKARIWISGLAAVHLLVILGATAIALSLMGSVAADTDTGSTRLPIMWAVQLAIITPVLAYIFTRDHWLIRLIATTIFQGLILLIPVLLIAVLTGLSWLEWQVSISVPDAIAPAVSAAVFFGPGIALTAAAYVINRVITHDAISLITITIFAALLGSAVGPLPCMAFLGAMLILDFFEVYIAKYMITAVERMGHIRLSPIFIFPLSLSGFLERTPTDFKRKDGDERRFGYLGLGDLGIPTMLVVSCIMFLDGLGPAVGTAIGIMAGYRVLGYMALNGKPHAGLPPIAGGALIGCVLGAVLTGVPLW